MKKLLAVLLGVVLAFALAACGNGSDKGNNAAETTLNTAKSDEPSEQFTGEWIPDGTYADESGSIVVTFSGNKVRISIDGTVNEQEYEIHHNAFYTINDDGEVIAQPFSMEGNTLIVDGTRLIKQ